MAEVDMNKVWPRISGGDTNKIGPWTPIKKIIDYKTSHNIAFPSSNPPPFTLKPQPHEKCEWESLPYEREIAKANYDTTYNHYYDWKYVPIDPVSQADMPHFRNFLFMHTMDEKMRSLPLRPITLLSEYKAKYPRYTEPLVDGEVRDQRQKLFCPIKGLTRDDVAKFDPAELGSGKHLDIYVSWTHMDYIHHKPRVLNKYKSSMIIEPVFPQKLPERIVKQRGEEGLLETFTKRSPLESTCSETMASFVKPAGMVEPIADCIIPQIKQTYGDVIAVPGMYHTEYTHIGHPWSSNGLVR